MPERLCTGALLFAVCFLGSVDPAAARYETYDWHLRSGGHETLVAVDGVVAVLHPLGETQRVKNRVLQALPGWRSRSLFAYQGASAETPYLSLFAHPDASAELVGFSGIDDGGPAASEVLAQLDAHFAGELFLTPLFVRYHDWVHYPTCGYMIPDRISLNFGVDVAESARLELIESLGGVVLRLDSYSFGHYYKVRIEGTRSGLQVLELANGLLEHPLVRGAAPDFELETVLYGGCGGPSGAPPGGGTGTGGGFVQPLAVPTLGSAGKLVLAAWMVVVGALLLGRRRE